MAAAQVWRTLEETRSPRNSLVELRFLVEAADVMTLHSPSERASHSLSSVRASGLPQCPARDGMGSAQQRLQIVCPPQNPDGAAHAATFHLRAANIHATAPAHAMHLHMYVDSLQTTLPTRQVATSTTPRPGHVVACACQQNRGAFPLATAVCLPNRAHPSQSHLDTSGPIAPSLQPAYGETPAPSSVTDPGVLTTGTCSDQSDAADPV